MAKGCSLSVSKSKLIREEDLIETNNRDFDQIAGKLKQTP